MLAMMRKTAEDLHQNRIGGLLAALYTSHCIDPTAMCMPANPISQSEDCNSVPVTVGFQP